MTGIEGVQPLMLQPMWVTVIVQLLTLIVAAGVSYGMTRTRLSQNEKEIAILHTKLAEIEKELSVWQHQRLTSVMTIDDCEKMQHICKDSVCKKIDTLTSKIDNYTQTAQVNWQNIAMVIGAICNELKIDPPELK